MGGIGMRELVVILLVVLVVFGAKKLRTVGSDLGHAVRGFKKAMSEGEDEQNAPPKQIRSEGARTRSSPRARRRATRLQERHDQSERSA